MVRPLPCKFLACGFESDSYPFLRDLFPKADVAQPYVPHVISTEAEQLNSYNLYLEVQNAIKYRQDRIVITRNYLAVNLGTRASSLFNI